MQKFQILYLAPLMKNILLFGAGKSATCLIDYLITETAGRNWQLTVADGNPALLRSKTGTHPQVHAIHLQIETEKEVTDEHG